MSIIIFFVLLCLSPAILSNKNENDELLKSWEKLFEPFRRECIKESGVNEDDVIDIEKLLNFPNYENFKCYLKCQYQHLHFVDTEGNFDVPTMLKEVVGITETVINTCILKASNENDLCNKSYTFGKCCVTEVLNQLNARHS
ncbi:hypothetical protein FQA39_LY19401 [Lamprigera yunnana]|nr:hypothetical protein FQA39_LY19401 [Lamprigera yunnana]